jgi:hypothetical protein
MGNRFFNEWFKGVNPDFKWGYRSRGGSAALTRRWRKLKGISESLSIFTFSEGRLRFHQVVVNELERIGSQAKLAAERPVEGEDQKDNQANEDSEKDDLDSLQPTVLDSKKRRV